MTSSYFGGDLGEEGSWYRRAAGIICGLEFWKLSVGWQTAHWCGRRSSCVASLPFRLIVTCVSLSSLEPLVLFSSFFPIHSYAESSSAYLPLEDRFYLVGSICVLRDQTLRVSMFCVCFPYCGIVCFLWKAMSPLVPQLLDSIAEEPDVCRGLC